MMTLRPSSNKTDYLNRGIGVSGVTSAQDAQIGRAGIDSLK